VRILGQRGNSGDFATALGLTESTVSHHLTQLRKAGLVGSRTSRHERLSPTPPRRPVGAVHCARSQLLSTATAGGKNDGAHTTYAVTANDQKRRVVTGYSAVNHIVPQEKLSDCRRVRQISR
jgi:DNA-binding IclR family transcriptional regulator